MRKEKEAEAFERGQVAEKKAQAHIEIARKESEAARLQAEEVVKKEIDKEKIMIDAEAVKEKKRIEAEGEALAILKVKRATAFGIKSILDAKADGYKRIVEACANDTNAAAVMLLIEKIEEIVKTQANAIKDLKIDKITVWDSSSGEGNSSTANFIQNLFKILPPAHEVSELGGLELPEYLGRLVKDAKKIIDEAKKKEVKSKKSEAQVPISKTSEKQM